MIKKPSFESRKDAERDQYLADAHAARMRELREVSDFEIAVELSAINNGRTCDACKTLDGNKYGLDYAPDIPLRECTSEMGCRCIVVPVTVIDEQLNEYDL